MVYLIGSLREKRVPDVAKLLRAKGFVVFDDWYAAGPHADDAWRDYEKARGHNMAQALKGFAARNVFQFDKTHLERATSVVLVMPAGKSGHLELGWALGKGKAGYVLLDGEPERYDVMYQFATGVYTDVDSLVPDLTRSEELGS